MGTLRVLMITPDFPPGSGGIQLVAYGLATHLRRCNVRVLAPGSPGARAWDATQDLDVQRVAAGRSHRSAMVRLNAGAISAARRFAPDVILALHIVSAPACAVIGRMLGIPVLTYLHAREVPARPLLARLAARTSSRLVAVSGYTAELAAGVGVTPGRIAVIPPGVDFMPLSAAARLRRPTVLTVSRIADRYKGHDVMVRALPLIRARVPDAQWVVVGDGPLRADIERLAAEHGVAGAIRFCGAIDNAVRDRWLSTAHVFAMPSRVSADRRTGEGFGIVYLEAGVHGLPVVAGRAGGALDAVVDGETGVLVDPADHVQVAAAVSDLLCDRERAARMGAAGRERAREFGWTEIAGRLEALMVDAAARR
jgi:phosphatidylinositol alpha-1,6-mannosyltransferase